MEKFLVKFKNDEIPKYIAITKHMKNLIDRNNLEDGEKLPSIRSLADLLKVNNVTIVSAYNKLAHDGYAVQKIGSGTYVKKKDLNKNFKKEYSESLKKICREKEGGHIDFTGETPKNDFFPVSSFKEVLNEVLDRDGVEALTYQEALGYEGLRQSISKVFWDGKVDIDNVLIVSGAQQGIDIVSRALINNNDGVIIEKPTYGGAISVFKWRRADIIDMPIEDDGININKLEKILMKNNIKCFYTMSYFQNPSGMSYSLEKREEILRLAHIYDFYIIEDDYLSELIYDNDIEYKSFKSLDKNDRVIYIKSFSKIFLPGIRIGYLILPERFKDSIQSSKINTDISTSSLMQRALELYITKGFWKKYIQKINEIYKERYFKMEKSLTQALGEKVSFKSPGGGMNFYLKIKEQYDMDSIELFRKARERGVLITPGTLFYKNPIEGLSYFRIGFSQTNKEQIEKGIKILDEILR